MKKYCLLSLLCLFSLNSFAQVSLGEFKKLVSIFHTEFDQELRAKNSLMIINNPPNPSMPDFWWNMIQRHASYSGYLSPEGQTTHYLFLFGGYAKIEGMKLEGVAMTLCHELGHGIGGNPLKDSGEKVRASVEGQADYYAARFCLKRILKHLPVKNPVVPLNGYVDTRCREHFKKQIDIEMCFRAFETLENERLFFRTQPGEETEVFYERPEQNTTNEINLDPYFYPTPQCRLDTMVNGVLGLERPLCWWKP